MNTKCLGNYFIFISEKRLKTDNERHLHSNACSIIRINFKCRFWRGHRRRHGFHIISTSCWRKCFLGIVLKNCNIIKFLHIHKIFKRRIIQALDFAIFSPILAHLFHSVIVIRKKKMWAECQQIALLAGI